jgi:hypothetical protein
VRSRPDLKVYLSPAAPAPGTRLRAQVVLTSRSATPIDGIEVHLAGVEQRQTAAAMMGSSAIPSVQSYRHLDLVARTPKALLTPGEHRIDFAFDIPAGSPPQYRSRTASIVYDLEVRVAIPWWPDRSGRFLVPVVAAPSPARGAAGAYCTDGRGPQGTALYVEASLESATVPLGGALRGAVSLANVAHHRIRRVELALLQTERARGSGTAGVEQQRYVIPLHQGAPAEGKALPFNVALPADATTSFTGSLLEVGWQLELRAVVALGSDVTLSFPFTVVRPAGDAPPAPSQAVRVPPVGRDRRALIWAESARRNGLANDADNERMTLDLGRTSLSITLEPRKASGLALTATVTWPRLGIDLAVAERRWVDAWSGGLCALDVPGFAERFTVRGREEAQVRAFLDEASCRWLLLFDEAAVGDEGATLVSAGTAQTLDELDTFVARAVAAARAFGELESRVPPPAAMADAVPAWRAFAAMLGGHLLVGEMSIHGAAFEEAPLVLATEWSKEGAPGATAVRFPLPERDGAGSATGASEPRHLDGQAQALVDSLTPRLTAFAITDRAIEARLPAPLADPATLEPVLAELGALARRLSGVAARGPYR